MRTETVTRNVGEYLGPVDWSYDFAFHFKGMSFREGELEKYIAQKVEWLRTLENNPDAYEATTDGGCPKFGWHRICAVGMYDGWPYWRPVPSVCLSGTLGAEWHSFDSITGINRIAGANA